MDFNRFLTTGGLALGSGGALSATHARAPLHAPAAQPLSDYERIFAESPHLPWLGLPRRWESVRQGFHPFSPERIRILPADHQWNLPWIGHKAEQIQKLLEHRPLDLSESFWISDAFRLYTEISAELSAYYPGVVLDDWLRALVLGEQLYRASFEQVKTLYSLQAPFGNPARVVNPPADWWLFLLRKPLDLETFDGRPVHLAVGQVHGGSPCRCEVGFLCQEWHNSLLDRGSGFIEHVSALDRVSAARLANLQIATVLERLNEKKW